ncbi:unnamed protein product [Photorhabdus laumondii subsp. laumondii TTO1]|uniref:Photorhabdus luminescens subsp. laumondii TTO1 complete genome segment 14/17 n=1 Tax=Photorhabdus laumondii subsp. laumondii (strain DSM 15139 / CIP 105565 / TT01) TaxID=243265 RepID=Q7N0J6_PHOLL|nr:unnamed protein product [Photorhabdus laumondii subsp. laumondii TTO1]
MYFRILLYKKAPFSESSNDAYQSTLHKPSNPVQPTSDISCSRLLKMTKSIGVMTVPKTFVFDTVLVRFHYVHFANRHTLVYNFNAYK